MAGLWQGRWQGQDLARIFHPPVDCVLSLFVKCSGYGRLNSAPISRPPVATPATPFPRKPAGHSREGGNPYHPSFPRRRKSIPSVIPAQAGIHPAAIDDLSVKKHIIPA